MDADGPGQEGTVKFAKKLGVSSTITLYLMIYVCSFFRGFVYHLYAGFL